MDKQEKALDKLVEELITQLKNQGDFDENSLADIDKIHEAVNGSEFTIEQVKSRVVFKIAKKLVMSMMTEFQKFVMSARSPRDMMGLAEDTYSMAIASLSGYMITMAKELVDDDMMSEFKMTLITKAMRAIEKGGELAELGGSDKKEDKEEE